MAGEGGSRAASMTLETLRTAFHQPREQAAETLGLTVNELKKALKLLGVARWPYRKLASLQSLHTDLEQQLQQFSSSQDDPAIANHVKDLQEMQARIADDTAKIMQDPNHPLDESLHKLRLQNYKARFLGKHGLVSTPPMLKLPPPSSSSAAVDPSRCGGDNEMADSQSNAYMSAMPEDSGTAGGMSGGTPARGVSDGEVGSSGRRRRAASIAASTSIKRAAGLVNSGSDDDEPPTTTSNKSRGSAGKSGGGPTSRAPIRAALHHPYQGAATLATLPSLPEGSVYTEGSTMTSRLAQSAPLFDEATGGFQFGSTHGGSSINSLNDSVAAISLQQQYNGGANLPPAVYRPAGVQMGARDMYATNRNVPAHLLPQSNSMQWGHVSSKSRFNQNAVITGSGVAFMGSSSAPKFNVDPASQASIYTDNSSVGTGCSGAFQNQTGQLHGHSQPLTMAAVLGPTHVHSSTQQHGWQNRHNPHSAPQFGAAYHAQQQQHMHSMGAQAAARPNINMPVVEPLVTPLEELLDEMMTGPETTTSFAAQLAATNDNSRSGMIARGGNQISMQGTAMMSVAGPTTGVPGLMGNALSVNTSGALPLSAAGPVTGAVSASVGQMASDDGAGRSSASMRRMPNSSIFLLNDDEEDDAMLQALLTSPPSNACVLGGNSRSLTQSAMDARTSSLLAQKAAQLEMRQQQQLQQLQQIQQQKEALQKLQRQHEMAQHALMQQHNSGPIQQQQAGMGNYSMQSQAHSQQQAYASQLQQHQGIMNQTVDQQGHMQGGQAQHHGGMLNTRPSYEHQQGSHAQHQQHQMYPDMHQRYQPQQQQQQQQQHGWAASQGTAEAVSCPVLPSASMYDPTLGLNANTDAYRGFAADSPHLHLSSSPKPHNQVLNLARSHSTRSDPRNVAMVSVKQESDASKDATAGQRHAMLAASAAATAGMHTYMSVDASMVSSQPHASNSNASPTMALQNNMQASGISMGTHPQAGQQTEAHLMPINKESNTAAMQNYLPDDGNNKQAMDVDLLELENLWGNGF